MRCLLLLMMLASPVMAADPSVTCAVEMGRREAIIASDYAVKQPPGVWWVGVAGQSLGPWTAIEVKRRIEKGDIAPDVWVYQVGRGTDWVLTSQSQDFAPLPGPADLVPGEDLTAVLSGCWVSDPVVEAAGDETTWLLMLFDNGSFFPSREVLTTASGKEGFWFSRSTQEPWQVNGTAPESFTLSLPDITYLDPADSFQARLVDRNQLRLDLPGIGAVTFRRM